MVQFQTQKRAFSDKDRLRRVHSIFEDTLFKNVLRARHRLLQCHIVLILEIQLNIYFYYSNLEITIQ